MARSGLTGEKPDEKIPEAWKRLCAESCCSQISAGMPLSFFITDATNSAEIESNERATKHANPWLVISRSFFPEGRRAALVWLHKCNNHEQKARTAKTSASYPCLP
jgi:hypothetical protein